MSSAETPSYRDAGEPTVEYGVLLRARWARELESIASLRHFCAVRLARIAAARVGAVVAVLLGAITLVAACLLVPLYTTGIWLVVGRYFTAALAQQERALCETPTHPLLGNNVAILEAGATAWMTQRFAAAEGPSIVLPSPHSRSPRSL